MASGINLCYDIQIKTKVIKFHSYFDYSIKHLSLTIEDPTSVVWAKRLECNNDVVDKEDLNDNNEHARLSLRNRSLKQVYCYFCLLKGLYRNHVVVFCHSRYKGFNYILIY